jgi:hypothetical protein
MQIVNIVDIHLLKLSTSPRQRIDNSTTAETPWMSHQKLY